MAQKDPAVMGLGRVLVESKLRRVVILNDEIEGSLMMSSRLDLE